MDYRNELLKRISDIVSFEDDLIDFTQKCILPNKSDLPSLYRYMPADYYNIRNLELNQLHLSEIGYMNDIYEGLSFKSDKNYRPTINEMKDFAYIKSFSENKYDLLMWSTYAQNYTGMCIKYDLSEATDDILYHLYPVIYSDTKFEFNIEFADAYSALVEMKKEIETGEGNFDESDMIFIEEVSKCFLIKSKFWKNEKEWRLMVTYAHMNRPCLDDPITFNSREIENKELYGIRYYDVDFPYAKEIYLGPAMETIKKEHIKEIGARLGINVFEAKLSNEEYKLNYDD